MQYLPVPQDDESEIPGRQQHRDGLDTSNIGDNDEQCHSGDGASYMPSLSIKRTRRSPYDIWSCTLSLHWKALGFLFCFLCAAVLFHPYLSTRPKHVEPSAFREVSWQPREPSRKALVLASFKKQDVTWINDISSEWEVFRYLNDDPKSKWITPTRQGNEAAAYLTFIIDHYHNLPDYMIFLHGHDRNWHSPEHAADKIRAANLTALRKDGYFNLRCTHLPGCTADSYIGVAKQDETDARWMRKALPGFIKYMYPEMPVPEILSSQCCAQFLVNKGHILGRSKEWWIAYREPLLGDLKRWSKEAWHSEEIVDGYRAGVLWEKCWHLAFGKTPVYCPSEEYCQRTLFSDKIHCDGQTGRFQQAKDMWMTINCTTTFEDDDLR